jgi:hypothetical protein
MTAVDALTMFLDRASRDPRIGPSHLSLYLGILYLWHAQGTPCHVEVSARKLMPLARIAGANTYHRTIRQLHRYGYLEYEPSNDPDHPSRIYL